MASILLIAATVALLIAGHRHPPSESALPPEAGAALTLLLTSLSLPLLLGVNLVTWHYGWAGWNTFAVMVLPGLLLAAVLLPMVSYPAHRGVAHYLGQRYTEGMQPLVALLSLCFQLTVLGATLALFAGLVGELLGWPTWVGVLLLAAASLLQARSPSRSWPLLAALLMAAAAPLFFSATPQLMALLPADTGPAAMATGLFLPADHEALPWPAVLLGAALVLGPWHWLGQPLTGAPLQALTPHRTRSATLLAATLLPLALVAMAAPGLLQPADTATAVTGGWQAGVLCAGLLASAMLLTVPLLRTSSRLVEHDLLQRTALPQDSSLLLIGLLMTAVVLQQGLLGDDHLLTGLVRMASLYQGPLLALLLAGALWRLPTPASGLLTLLGTLLAAVLLSLIGLHPLYVAGVTFVLALVTIIGVSKYTPAQDPDQLDTQVLRHER